MFKTMTTLFIAVILPPVAGAVEAVGSVLYDPMRPAIMAPTLPPTESEAGGGSAVVVEEEPLLLQAIKYHPQRPLAVINGKLVAVGEEIAGAKLQRLDRQQAILIRQGRSIILTLTSTSIKP